MDRSHVEMEQRIENTADRRSWKGGEANQNNTRTLENTLSNPSHWQEGAPAASFSKALKALQQNGDATREAPILDAPPFGDSSGSIPVQLATKKKKFAFPPVNATSPDCFINVTSARHGSCPQYGVRHRTVVGESGARFEGDVAVNPSA